MDSDLTLEIKTILSNYSQSFSDKSYSEENNDVDVLMALFGITPELKRENRQYWGRELGMCWQLLVNKVCELRGADYSPALKIEKDEPTDLFLGQDAIDTKYRIGSGDSGTLKKFKKYGEFLRDQGYNPVLLILRDDNLSAAITACKVGGWQLFIGKDCLNYVEEKTGFDIEKYLLKVKEAHHISRL